MTGNVNYKGAEDLSGALSSVFELEGSSSQVKAHLPVAIQFKREDVLTAKLKCTTGFYATLAKSNVTLLPPEVRDQDRVFSIFMTIAQITYLARSKFADLKRPGFWVRDIDTMRAIPAFPVEHVAECVGLTPATLRACMVPFVKDKALEFVRSPEGVAAILLKGGFMQDLHVRRHIKV
jgi:hypothetical protein